MRGNDRGGGGPAIASIAMRVLTVALLCAGFAASQDASQFVTVISGIKSDSIITKAPKAQRLVSVRAISSTSFRWDSTSCSTAGAVYLSSNDEGPFGFNARYPYLVDMKTLGCDADTLQFALLFDPFYVVPAGGDIITMHFSPIVTLDGVIPWTTNGTAGGPTFTIIESQRYASVIPSSLRFAAEVASTTTLLSVGVLLRKPSLVAAVPRLQFFRSLAICEFNYKYNVGRLQYPLQVAVGSTAYQLLIPVAWFNFALFAFVVFVDCAIFYSWFLFTRVTRFRNEALLPPGLREHEKRRLLNPAAADIEDALKQLKYDGDFYVIKSLPSVQTVAVEGADGTAISEKKRKRLEAEALEKLDRTIAKRQAERAAEAGGGAAEGDAAARKPGSDDDDGDVTVRDNVHDPDIKPSSRPAVESHLRPYDAPDPPAVDPAPIPIPPEQKAELEAARVKAEAEKAEKERLENRTPDEVDRDLAAAEKNIIVKLRIHARRVRRWMTNHAAPVVRFLAFLGDGRLPSPYWFLLFLWAEPVVSTVLVVLWNSSDDSGVSTTQLLVALALAPWGFLLLWTIRVLLRGFPMRFFDEDEGMIAMETAAREERILAVQQEHDAKVAFEAARKKVQEEKDAEAKAKADAALLKQQEEDKAKAAVEAANAAVPSSSAVAVNPTDVAPAAAQQPAAPPAKESVVAAPAAESPTDLAPEAAASPPPLPPRAFPEKPLLQRLVQGYGRWIYSHVPAAKVDVEEKRKKRLEEELRQEREKFMADFEHRRVAAAAALNKLNEPAQTEEAKKEEAELLKTEEAPLASDAPDAANDKADSDDDSVVTHISDSKKTGTKIFILCDPLHVPSLPTQEDADEAAAFHRSYADLYWHYRPLRHWFAVVEITASIFFGILESVRTSLGCIVIAGPAIALAAVYLGLLLWLRPAVAPLDNLLYVVLAGLYLWCSVWYTLFAAVDIDQLEGTGTSVQNIVELLLPVYLLLTLSTYSRPLWEWVAHNERVYFSAYPWFRSSTLAAPLEALRVRVSQWRSQLEEWRRARQVANEERQRTAAAEAAKAPPPAPQQLQELAVPLLILPAGEAVDFHAFDDKEDDRFESRRARLLSASPERDPSSDELSDLISIRSVSTVLPTPAEAKASGSGQLDDTRGSNVDTGSTESSSQSDSGPCSTDCSCCSSPSSKSTADGASTSAVTRSCRQHIVGSAVSSSEGSSRASSRSTVRTILFEDEHGNKLTAAEVAERLRAWQRRHHMPNVTADMLPLPREELRQMVKQACADRPDDEIDDAVLALVMALQQNAYDGTNAKRAALMEEGRAATAEDPAGPAQSNQPPRRVLNFNDEESLVKFERFYGRRPRQCCVVQ